MTKLQRIRTWIGGAGLATGLVAGLAACGGAETLVIPLFVFGFGGTSGGTPVGVFFDPDSPTTATGTFNFVNLNVDGRITPYSGSWNNCSFTMTVQAGQTAQAPAAASYSGRFQGVNTVVLTPTSGNGLPTLTLTRQGAAPTAFDC